MQRKPPRKMEPDTFTDSMDLKVRELLKEVRLDYSPAFTQLVEDTVSAIKDGIDKIPEDLKVRFFSFSSHFQNPRV